MPWKWTFEQPSATHPPFWQTCLFTIFPKRRTTIRGWNNWENREKAGLSKRGMSCRRLHSSRLRCVKTPKIIACCYLRLLPRARKDTPRRVPRPAVQFAIVLCSPNEDFEESNQHFFQQIFAKIEYSHPWKVLRRRIRKTLVRRSKIFVWEACDCTKVGELMTPNPLAPAVGN